MRSPASQGTAVRRRARECEFRILCYYGLPVVRTNSTKRERVISAWCCLVAALLLFAPYAEAAWSAHAAACCTGDHCPIPAHHHSRNDSKAPAHAQDCEHQAGDVMSDCSMSCCEKTERMLLAATTFVLPAGLSIIASDEFVTAAPALKLKDFVRCIEVLSPPPRS
ncbi:MAG: hypothetical protein M3P45_16445 [Acidobacteriota bacterium]|nr:hypothetical protein [Acidobacteriota bacterium]